MLIPLLGALLRSEEERRLHWLQEGPADAVHEPVTWRTNTLLWTPERSNIGGEAPQNLSVATARKHCMCSYGTLVHAAPAFYTDVRSVIWLATGPAGELTRPQAAGARTGACAGTLSARMNMNMLESAV